MEDVLKLKLKKEILIVKHLMLTIYVLNVQKVLSLILLEFVSQLILHV